MKYVDRLDRVLLGKQEGKGPFGRPTRRCDDNAKMDLQGIGLGTWAGLMWLRIRTGGFMLCLR
jgi:hypothetical protein